ncbi:MAG: L-seryl-tRNA(Sec) selenium transferase [Actinomycetota bacterium]|nr:L-seryl-tRNA(Sec) selenium transferase [Actinomycetota bacterium]
MGTAPTPDRRRQVPRTDAVLADPRLRSAAERVGPEVVKTAVRGAQEQVRTGDLAPESVADRAVETLPASATSMRAVVNATGVLVHTNLGRAPLSAAAVDAVRIAAGNTDVELDLSTGRRGRRGAAALAALAAAVPEADAVHVVNNNAAALVLATTALAVGREIVVSRGELVEIGDGFRIPELLTATGARLREVGTTNRVHVDDYAAAIGPDTAMVLKVHPSNFVVSGFTSQVGVAELAGLGVPVVADVGSGLLQAHPLLPDEPDAGTALSAGAALVTASGDKLLGGPQCGLLLGDRDLVERLRRNPIARALRVDKLTLAALEATLRGTATPVAQMLSVGTDELGRRARHVAARLVAAGIDTTVVSSLATVGGGGAPGVQLASVAVSLPADFAARLRHANIPVVGRVEDGRTLLDLRSVSAADDALLTAAALEVAAG